MVDPVGDFDKLCQPAAFHRVCVAPALGHEGGLGRKVGVAHGFGLRKETGLQRLYLGAQIGDDGGIVGHSAAV